MHRIIKTCLQNLTVRRHENTKDEKWNTDEKPRYNPKE